MAALHSTHVRRTLALLFTSPRPDGTEVYNPNHERQRATGEKTIRIWKQAKVLLEQWRRDLTNVSLELKRPRVIGVVPIEFVSGEPVEREGTPTNRFRGQAVYFTNADVTVRLPSGAVLVIDNYEIIAMSDGKKQLSCLVFCSFLHPATRFATWL
jgi:hypothetical protein